MFTTPVAHFKAAGGGAVFPTTNNEWRFESDLGITKDGSNNLTAWADQSGNSRNLIAGAGAYPVWTDAILNGKPVIRCNVAGGAVQQMNRIAWWTDATGPVVGEAVLVGRNLRSAGVTNFGHWGFGNDGGWNGTNYAAADGTIYETVARSSFIQTANAGGLDRAFHIYRVQWNGNSGAYLYKVTLGGSVLYNSSSAFTVKWTRSSGFYYLFTFEATFKGLLDIALCAGWSKALSAGEWSGFAGYVQNKWGAAVT